MNSILHKLESPIIKATAIPLQIKLRMESGHSVEIPSSSLSFSSLSEWIISQLSSDAFDLFYYDNDEDRITISGQNDLDNYFLTSPNELPEIHLQTRNSNDEEESKDNEVLSSEEEPLELCDSVSLSDSEVLGESGDGSGFVVRQTSTNPSSPAFSSNENEFELVEGTLSLHEMYKQVKMLSPARISDQYQYGRNGSATASLETMASRLSKLEGDLESAMNALHAQKNHFEQRLHSMEERLMQDNEKKISDGLVETIDNRMRIALGSTNINGSIGSCNHSNSQFDCLDDDQQYLNERSLEKTGNQNLAINLSGIHQSSIIDQWDITTRFQNNQDKVHEIEDDASVVERLSRCNKEAQNKYALAVSSFADGFAKLSKLRDSESIRSEFEILQRSLRESLEAVKDSQLMSVSRDMQLKYPSEELKRQQQLIQQVHERQYSEVNEQSISQEKSNGFAQMINEDKNVYFNQSNCSQSEQLAKNSMEMEEKEEQNISDEDEQRLKCMHAKIIMQQSIEDAEIERILREKEEQARLLNEEVFLNMHKDYPVSVVEKAKAIAAVTGENTNEYLKFVYDHRNLKHSRLFELLFTPRIVQKYFS